MSFEPLLRDKEFESILGSKESVTLFLDLLTLFTMIDVWGYHINDISATMIGNYLEIREEMRHIFVESVDRSEILKGLGDKSRKHLDWRLMGYMMAFSKIGRKPHLTLDFYGGMIQEGFRTYAQREDLDIEWNRFKDDYLTPHAEGL